MSATDLLNSVKFVRKRNQMVHQQRTRTNLIFARQSIHLNQLVMVVEYQLDARQQVISWFLFFQAIALPMIFPNTLQCLHAHMKR